MSKKELFVTMSWPYMLTCMLTLLILSVLHFMICRLWLKPKNNLFQVKPAIRQIEITFMAIAVTCTLLTTQASNLILAGIQHGVFDPETTLSEIQHRISKTPKESVVKSHDELSDSILIFFKFGCSDCEAVYQDLTIALDGQPDIYWISTRSQQGKNLLSKYPIDETPALIYIYPDGERFAKFQLHTTNESGQVVLNTKLLERALNLRQEQQTQITKGG